MQRVSAHLARVSARIEATLSTHGFTALFLVIYGLSVALMFLWGFWTEFDSPKNIENEPLLFRWLIGCARGAGYTLNLNTALVLLLASRLFLTALRDTALGDVLPLDKSFPVLHIVVAYTILASLFIHVPFHFAWIGNFNRWTPGLWQFNMSVATGVALMLVFGILFVFARPWMRKKHFRVFYIVHLTGAFLFFSLLIFHGMYNGRPETYKYVIPPLIIYILDRIIRLTNMSTHNLELSAENSVFKDDNILQLSIPKPFNFRPGQYADIMVPSINHEWHPFTIASAQYEDTMSFYIKSLGDWTGSLHTAFQRRLAGDVDTPLRLIVRGPFGAPTQEVSKYQRVFLISGGIGATPFTSICKQLHHLKEKYNAPISLSHRAKDKERKMMDSLLADGAEQSIRHAISSIYDIDTAALTTGSTELHATRVEHVARMLRVTSRGENEVQGINASSSDYGSDSGNFQANIDTSIPSSASTVDDSNAALEETGFWEAEATNAKTAAQGVRPPAHAYKREEMSFTTPVAVSDSEKRIRQKMARLRDVRTNILLFLHTSRVTFALTVLAVARIGVIIAGSIFKSDYVEMDGSFPNPPRGRWVPLAYASLSVPIAMVLGLTVLFEISFLKGRVFASARRFGEVFVFGPTLIVMTALEFRRWAKEAPGEAAFIVLQYIFAQATVFIFLVGRMWRAVGKCGLLDYDEGKACTCKSHGSHIPDADFVWTTPYSANDEWLRRELCAVADGSAVRVHRYVTRGKEDDKNVDSGLDLEDGQAGAMREATQTGRPDWDKLLAAAARDTRSDGVVGIFFCGPHSMGKAVRESSKRVEMWSNLRDAYLRSTDVPTLMNDLGVTDATIVKRLRKYGCRVRFVYHEENFN